MVHPAGHVADSLSSAIEALRANDATLGEIQWLDESTACDVPFRIESGDAAAEAEAIERAIRQALQGWSHEPSVDLAVQPATGRRKKLLVADMESTVIRNEMLDELADYVGVRSRVEEITRRAMNGELDFHEALAERVALLQDLPLSTLEDAQARVVDDPGAELLVKTLRRHGVHCALVSGGFTVFADRVKKRLGFHEARANVLEVSESAGAENRLTGRVVPPILDRDAKLRTLHELCERLGLEPSEAVAVGDGANDLAMLQAAGLGVAYHGKPAVAEAARFRVDHGDLSTLLYFQGYRADEILR